MTLSASGDPSGEKTPKDKPLLAAHPTTSGLARYVWTLLGTMVACFGLFYLIIFSLSATGHLSPPGFSNSLCADEKLANMRANPVGKPNLLVIGSSVAWRHFDGDAARGVDPDTIPYNGGFCGLSLNQTAYTTEWLLSHYGSAREVLLIASPQDFENCTTTRTAVFDSADADEYVHKRASPWLYYIKYFSPAALLRNALTVKLRRSDENASDPLLFDRYGSGPLKTPGDDIALVYGDINQMDPACFDALTRLAARLHRDDRRFMVASTPMNRDWKKLYDADNALQNAFSAGIVAVLSAQGGEFWNADAEHIVGQDGFRDAFHLDWSAVAPFTKALAEHFDFS
jgi:hypothetical protein